MSSVGVLMKRKKNSKCFCEEKKSKCPKKNFQSVKRGKKCLSIEFRVFEKNERKVPRKNVLGGNFAKFVFTGWALC